MNLQTLFDILPAYLLLSLLPVASLVLGAIIAPMLYDTRRWLSIILNLAGLVGFVWVGFIVFIVAIIDFDLNSVSPLPWYLILLLAILSAALFFGAIEWLTWRILRHLRAKKTRKTALDYFHEGYSCAQSVVAPFASELGLTEAQTLRFASGFGAGIGRMRETCGAFCGLTLIAGHCRGNLQGNAEEKETIFSLVREEAELFRTEFGSLQCRDLLNLKNDTQESARPSERTEAYYAARPCERCVAFCEQRARALLTPPSAQH